MKNIQPVNTEELTQLETLFLLKSKFLENTESKNYTKAS